MESTTSDRSARAPAASTGGLSPGTTSILVIADTRFYRDAVAEMIDNDDELSVIGACGTGEALAEVDAHRPDLVLLDMTSRHARELIRSFARHAPHTKVVALGIPETEHNIVRCAEAGVAGYVTANASGSETICTVKSIARNELPCSPRVAAVLLQRIGTLAGEHAPMDPPTEALTRREFEILRLVGEGLSNKEISESLYIQVATVKTHVHNILQKLNVDCRGQAAAWHRRGRARLDGGSGPTAALSSVDAIAA